MKDFNVKIRPIGPEEGKRLSELRKRLLKEQKKLLKKYEKAREEFIIRVSYNALNPESKKVFENIDPESEEIKRLNITIPRRGVYLVKWLDNESVEIKVMSGKNEGNKATISWKDLKEVLEENLESGGIQIGG
jgi:hypothetical protein